MTDALSLFSSASGIIHGFISPVMYSLSIAGTLVCALFLTVGGYHYIVSSGNPAKLEKAKQVIKNSLIGLIVVLGAGTLTLILSHAYPNSQAVSGATLPTLNPVKAIPVSNGLLDIIIKAVTGLLNDIVQSVASPFLSALSFFTSGTPILTQDSAVFNLWLVLVAIADTTFAVVIALLGFHIMGAGALGFEEVEIKHLLPRLALVFGLINSSIFLIDGAIELSNAMIKAVNEAGSSTSVWNVLTTVVKHTGGQGVAALLIMVTFVILSVMLLIYYIGRLVTLYLGAVLSPLVFLLWLVPGFKDFSESAAKVYLTAIFVLLVHVVILDLAASLFLGIGQGSNIGAPDTLIAMLVGLSTIVILLKTEGLMMQLSYVSAGPKTLRKLGGELITGFSYVGSGIKGTIDEAKRTNMNSPAREKRAYSPNVEQVKRVTSVTSVQNEAPGGRKTPKEHARRPLDLARLEPGRSKSRKQTEAMLNLDDRGLAVKKEIKRAKNINLSKEKKQ